MAAVAWCLQFAGSHRMVNFDRAEDGQQLLRNLADHSVTLPAWRQQRPALLVESADYAPTNAVEGTLVLSGYIRCAAMSANQNIHIPGGCSPGNVAAACACDGQMCSAGRLTTVV